MGGSEERLRELLRTIARYCLDYALRSLKALETLDPAGDSKTYRNLSEAVKNFLVDVDLRNRSMPKKENGSSCPRNSSSTEPEARSWKGK